MIDMKYKDRIVNLNKLKHNEFAASEGKRNEN